MRHTASLRDRAGLAAGALRQLTFRQAVHRPVRLLPPAWLAGRPGTGTILRPLARGTAVTAAPQSGPVDPPHVDGVLRAVGRQREFAARDVWNDTSDGMLFLFELHGFAEFARYANGDRTSAGDEFWEWVLDSWLQAEAVPSRPAWHPFPVSGRILAWCSAMSTEGWSGDLRDRLAASLVQHLRLLRRSVEYDIGGNHVLRNACALVVGGLCCADTKAQRRGWSILEAELPRQVLVDGCHEERSPSYARLILEDLRDVVTVAHAAAAAVPTCVPAAIERMGHALRALAGPDGRVPMLNDAWHGPALAPLTESETDLHEAGLLVLRAEGGDQVVLNIGPLCPPHLPPHAHAHALSFVLWLGGRPMVVDPGCGGYEPDDRRWARATRSHATVEVAGRDQCRFWGPFRASELPNVTRVAVDRSAARVLVTASHDGYARLPRPVVHQRTFCWLPGDGLVVVDQLIGGPVVAESRLPLAPDVPAGLQPRTLDGRLPQETEGVVAPYFGVRQPARVLTQPAVEATSGWIITRSAAQVKVHGSTVEITRPGRDSIRFDCLGCC